jgi:hypothetical protein
MCPCSVAAAGAFYFKGAAFVEQDAIELHIGYCHVAVGLKVSVDGAARVQQTQAGRPD